MDILKSIENDIYSVDRLNDNGVPSASIVVQHPSGEIETHIITNGPENPETIYQACSISKAITALAVARLVDEGRLSYDTKIYQYVPQAIRKSITPLALLEHVTIAHLVTHTSGLSRHGMPGYPEGQEMPTYEEFFAGATPSNTERIRFLSFPGAQYSYSGGAMTLLQVVLESLTGLPFPQFMKETVLEPLGMTRSLFGDLVDDEKNFAAAHLTAYVLGTEIGRGYHRFLEHAAAGLWTTPTDLTKAVAAIQRSLQRKGGFLTSETARKLLTRREPIEESKNVAMGWFSDENFFAHAGGNDPGYTCYAMGSHGRLVNQTSSAPSTPDCRFESGNTSIVIMTNAWYGLTWQPLQKLVLAIFYQAGWSRGSTLPSLGSSFTDCVPFALLGDSPAEEWWHAWLGKWSDGWEIIEDVEKPMVQHKDVDMPLRLLPAAAPTAKHESGRAEHVFVVEGLNTALWLTFDHGEQVIELVQNTKKILRRVVT